MFGEDYFNTRQHLTDVVLRIIELADKTGADKTPLLENDITQGLTNPFLFVACGEVNAGKSTFLNGLFGQDFCKMNVLPETDRVQWYRYGKTPEDKEVTPILEERYRSVDFLMDFNLVDTPGTNSVVEGHQTITEQFLPVADLVFWVFPASNPWGATTWDFIAKQDQKQLEKSIFIIQQADLREEKDIDVILMHMKDLSQKRMGMTPPIFPVAGKLSLKAKKETPFDEDLWRVSGYPKLEKHVSEIVTASPSRKEALLNAHGASTSVLVDIEGMIELRTRLLEDNENFLREIEREVDQERDNQSFDSASKFHSMREVFISQSMEIKSLINQRLSIILTLKSFFSAENIPKIIESSLVDSVKSAVEQQANYDGGNLVEECRKHWETVRPRVAEHLAIQLDDFDTESNGFSGTRENFTKRMGRAARQAVVSLKIRGGFDMQLAQRRNHLRKWLYAVLIMFMASGICGALKLGPNSYIALAFLALAVFCIVGFILRTSATRKEILELFSERLVDARVPFADALGDDYREGVRDFYVEYSNLLGGVRHHIANAKMELQPNLEIWNGLFLELKALEQKL